MDSCTITGPAWRNEWWCPVGLRYHALHHLFPALPYHNLPEAHRRLMAGLPADHPYRSGLHRGYLSAVGELTANCGTAGVRGSGPGAV